MGAWGSGSFENDAALDFIDEIESIADFERVLEDVVDDTLMDADLASRVVVVAECVAAMQGYRNPAMPIELANKVHGFGKPPLELYERAREQLAHAISQSELAQLWAEGDGPNAFNIEMTQLIERLNSPVKKTRKPRKKKLEPNHSPCMICDKAMGHEEFSMFDITLDDGYGPAQLGGYVHLACLNAALHPKYMIQNWQFSDEMLDRIQDKMLAEESKE